DPEDRNAETDHHVSYTAHVRADGAEATLSKKATDLDETEELAAGDVPEFRPYPAVTGEESGRGEEPVNNLKLACEFHSDGDDGVLVRKHPILYDRGQRNDPLRILYESYRLHEIRD